jgi:hypothetical protein
LSLAGLSRGHPWVRIASMPARRCLALRTPPLELGALVGRDHVAEIAPDANDPIPDMGHRKGLGMETPRRRPDLDAHAREYLGPSTAVLFISTPIRRIGAPRRAMNGGVVGRLLSRPKLIAEGVRRPPPIGEVE